MSIRYYSIYIITNDLSDNVFSGVFGVDLGSDQVIKFFDNTNPDVNILNSDPVNANGADWIFNDENRFSANGTNINSIPLLNISGAQKFTLYTVNTTNYIAVYNGIQWFTIANTFTFRIQYIATTEPFQRRGLTIDQYCSLQQRRGKTRMGGCITALPLSKKYLNYGNATNSTTTSGNVTTSGGSCPTLRNKMRYAEYVRTYGTTKESSSGIKKFCLIAGPSFSY